MAKNLVIVESPAKAKTIEKYLGKDFAVKSSMGHIRDLPKKGLAIDKDNKFMPTYEISTEKKKLVTELKKAAKDAEVWLATDEDREGEAIAWHLCQALKLDPKQTKRIVFHEITKPAILQAIEKPRTVDLNLVDAQQARRILDRLVGYELSPVLWKKIQTGLSAGRVQSVAVRLIVEREREIKAFNAASSFKVTAELAHGGSTVSAELDKRFDSETEATQFLEACKTATYGVASAEKKPGTRNPSAPFTTSTLQQEAARRLGISVKTTMQLAQRLYENGHITYMRTDSVNLSTLALDAAGTYISKTFGTNYHHRRQFTTKQESAQEAHEAIRPTDFTKSEAGADALQKKLYRLIWQRTLASQMAAAKVEKTEVKIAISTRPELLIASGEVLQFDGFLKVYGNAKDDTLLPPLQPKDQLQLNSMQAKEVFSRPPARYSEASLVKKLEEAGIGRPSTYAPTISTIQDRGYVEKKDLDGQERQSVVLTLQAGAIARNEDTERYGADKAKLVPTHLADVVTDFLMKYFEPIVDYDFTAKSEAEFDRIAEGEHQWNAMIEDFYRNKFHPLVEQSASATRAEAAQARQLGFDPSSARPITARFGRYGPMLQIGDSADEEKPKFAPMPKGTTIDTVTLEQALEMFKLPRVVGTTEDGHTILTNIGRFGPYLQVGSKYTPLKTFDPLTVTEAEAREVLVNHVKTGGKEIIKEFEKSKIKVVKGPYGPYVTDGKKNGRIPKSTAPEDLTLEEAEAIMAKATTKKKGGRRFSSKKKK